MLLITSDASLVSSDKVTHFIIKSEIWYITSSDRMTITSSNKVTPFLWQSHNWEVTLSERITTFSRMKWNLKYDFFWHSAHHVVRRSDTFCQTNSQLRCHFIWQNHNISSYEVKSQLWLCQAQCPCCQTKWQILSDNVTLAISLCLTHSLPFCQTNYTPSSDKATRFLLLNS